MDWGLEFASPSPPTLLPRREGANDRGRMKLISGVLERF